MQWCRGGCLRQTLRGIEGPLAGAVIVLGERTRLGRGAHAEVHLGEPAVSRKHAQILRQSTGEYVLVDLASQLGTFVAGARVGCQILRNGDVIRIASNVFLFEDSRPESSAPTYRLLPAVIEPCPRLVTPAAAAVPDPTVALGLLRDIFDYRSLRTQLSGGADLLAGDLERFAGLRARLEQPEAAAFDNQEARRFERFDCALPVLVTQRDERLERSLVVEVDDLSAGGARLVLSDAGVPLGAELQLVFDLGALSGALDSVVFRARVVWAVRERESLGVVFAGQGNLVRAVRDAKNRAPAVLPRQRRRSA